MTRHAIEGFLSRAERGDLVAMHDRLEELRPDFKPGYKHAPSQVLLRSATSSEIDLLDRVRGRILEIVRDHWSSPSY
jgi:hypothetical protein